MNMVDEEVDEEDDFFSSAAVVRRAAVVDDEDDDDNNDVKDDDNDGDDDGDDDAVDEEENLQTASLLSFFNDAPGEELAGVAGCSKRIVQQLLRSRPFQNMAALTEHLPSRALLGARQQLAMQEQMEALMAKCERIACQVASRVEQLARQVTLQELPDSDEAAGATIRRQPRLLCAERQLKPYQLVGLNWLCVMQRENVNAILADEMGLGKTVQTVAFLAQLLEEGHPGPHLVVVPSSTLDNWRRELTNWCPALQLCVYHGAQNERWAMRDEILEGELEFNVMLTTYSVATAATPKDRRLLRKVRFMYGIFDEAHMLRNMTSQRFRYLSNVNAQRRLLLTGTPVQNNLIELTSLLSFLMPDLFLEKDELFKSMFQIIGNKTSANGSTDVEQSAAHSQTEFERARIEHAKHLMKPFVLRRFKSQVLQQLPSKINSVARVSMPVAQRQLYDSLIEEMRSRIIPTNDLATTAANKKKNNNQLMQLRKAALHPLLHRKQYSDELLRDMARLMLNEPSHREEATFEFVLEDMSVMSDYELHRTCQRYPDYIGKFRLSEATICSSAKFQWLDESLPKMKAAGDRVLIFSQFTMLLDILEEYLQFRGHNFVRLDGSTLVNERQVRIDAFNAADSPHFICLLSTRAGGLGINLCSANVVLMHDLDFNPYNDKQAEDRCHRLGQLRQVQVIRLLVERTVEEGILRIAERKLQLDQDLSETGGESAGAAASKDDAETVAGLMHDALALG